MHSLEIIKALNEIAYKKEMADLELRKEREQHVTEQHNPDGTTKHIYL